MSTETVKVIFRKYRTKGGEVIAIFPQIPANSFGYAMQCYVHTGQHGSADYGHVLSQTRLATPEEYAALKKELESEPFKYVFKVALKSGQDDVRNFGRLSKFNPT
jgi:hypothetical protein